MGQKPINHKERRKRVRLNLANMKETVARLVGDVKKGKGFTIFTLNLDHLVKMRFDPRFRAAYLRARYVTADGWPVVWLGRQKGADLQRTTGADMVEPLCEEAARQGLPVYFFGSSDKALRDASCYLKNLYPDLDIVGMRAPDYGFAPDSPEADEAIKEIARSKAGLCFVALGAPKQELFADRAFAACPQVGFLCIGAALDFLGGHQSRAPLWMQKSGLEWLYRLLTNPLRLAGRYARSMLVLAEMTVRRWMGLSDDRIDFSVWDLKK